jgi:hypothetical protein
VEIRERDNTGRHTGCQYEKSKATERRPRKTNGFALFR